MAAEDILEHHAEEAGWSEILQIALLCEYIDNQADNAAFEDFLIQAKEEECGGPDPDELEPKVSAVFRINSFDRPEYTFDATPWFAQADDEDLVTVATSGRDSWGPSDASDEVAEYCGLSDERLAARFRLLHALEDANLNECGSDVELDEDEATAWVRAHRPHLLPRLTAGEEAAG